MFRILFSIGFIQVIGLVINTIRAKIVALLLGPAGFGVVATIDQLVLSASQLSNLSLPFTALKFLSRGHSMGEDHFRKYYAAFFKAITALAVLATVIAIALIGIGLDELDPQLAKYRLPVLIALLGIPATMLLVFFVNMLAARQKTMQSVVLSTAYSLVIMIAGGIGCAVGGVTGFYLAVVPASTALIIGMAIYMRSGLKLAHSSSAMQIWKDLQANAEIAETALFTYLAVGAYSVFMLMARYASITELGEVGAGLLQAVLAVSLSLGAVLLPANTSYFTPYVNRAIPVREKIDVANAFLPRLVFLYSLGALPVLLFPELVLQVLYSHRFTAAATLLPLFVIWQGLYQMLNVYQQLLIGIDDVRVCCVVIILGFVIAGILCFSLAPPFGLFGIGMAFIAGTLATAAGCIARLHRKHQFTVPASNAGMILVTVTGFAAIASVSRFSSEMTVTGLGVRAVAGTAFLAVLWLVSPRALSAELSHGVTARMSRAAGRR
jgi:antigen flippase